MSTPPASAGQLASRSTRSRGDAPTTEGTHAGLSGRNAHIQEVDLIGEKWELVFHQSAKGLREAAACPREEGTDAALVDLSSRLGLRGL